MGLLHIPFIVVYIPYERPLPAHLVIFNETSCLSMIYMIGEKFGLGYSPIAAIVVGFGVH